MGWQLKFLFLCSNHGAMPKGLRSQIPKTLRNQIMGRDFRLDLIGRCWQHQFHIYTKKYNAIKRIASLKKKLKENFWLSGFSIE